MSAKFKLLVVDDHALFRRGLVALLTQDERFSVSGQAGDIGDGAVGQPRLRTNS